jgi:hypothetical protein
MTEPPIVSFGEIGFYVTEIHEGLDEAERRGMSLDDVHRAMNVNAGLGTQPNPDTGWRLGPLAATDITSRCKLI